MWRTCVAHTQDHASSGEQRYELALRDFDQYLRKVDAYTKPRRDQPERVPQSEFWFEDDGGIVGVVRVRHWLTEALRSKGGHIGYAIPPSMRRKRYGTRLLALGLVEAKRLGINPARVTVDAGNIGSIKVIEANGGKLDGSAPDPHRRYWVHV